MELTSLQTPVRTPGLNFEMPPLSSLRNWGRQVQRDWPSCLLKGEMCALPPTQLLSRCPARTSFLSAPVSYTGLSTATRGQSLLTERCCGSSKDNCPNWILFFCFKYLNKTKQYKRSQITYSGHREDSQPFLTLHQTCPCCSALKRMACSAFVFRSDGFCPCPCCI